MRPALERRHSTYLRTIVAATVTALTVVATSLLAQQPPLKPPPGHKVAVVVFEDLQCPDCARASLMLREETRAYSVPLIRRDFPLPRHNWAFQAAVLARYFDTVGLGDAFRDYIYLYQPQITADNLRNRAEEFARRQNARLPVEIDSKGQLGAKVQADIELGRKLGVEHTPTVYVVNDRSTSKPLVEVFAPLELSARIREAAERSR